MICTCAFTFASVTWTKRITVLISRYQLQGEFIAFSG
jgi:hypothetical protein